MSKRLYSDSYLGKWFRYETNENTFYFNITSEDTVGSKVTVYHIREDSFSIEKIAAKDLIETTLTLYRKWDGCTHINIGNSAYPGYIHTDWILTSAPTLSNLLLIAADLADHATEPAAKYSHDKQEWQPDDGWLNILQNHDVTEVDPPECIASLLDSDGVYREEK